MKASFGKLKKIALHHHKRDGKEKTDDHLSAQLEGLAQSFQDMQDMKACYDSLLSAAAAATNCVYELSEALLEMGTCLLDKTGLSGDGESGRVLSMLGNVQLELQKYFDSYRSHIIVTITKPSESLLGELRKVEEMKLQCDEKREIYEYMMKHYKEKGRLRSGTGATFTSQQLKDAREEYDEVARLCIFRVQSLKQGQCRSILTQAARHHSAQLNFFRKGLKSLEAVEPHVRLLANKQCIDYQFSGLDDGDIYETNDDGELSFDYRKNKQGFGNITSRNSMELETSHPQVPGADDLEMNNSKYQGEHIFSHQPREGSHSAPIYVGKNGPSERTKEALPIRKVGTHVLPTPSDTRSSGKTANLVPTSPPHVPRKSTQNMWHSSPLDIQKRGKNSHDDNLSHSATSKVHNLLSKDNASVQLPPPLTEGLSLSQWDTQIVNDMTNVRRQAFSDPLSSKPSSTKSISSASGPITGGPSGLPMPLLSSSLNLSQSTSPAHVSSPIISELHELPRPPGSLASKPESSVLLGHSAPLISGKRDLSPVNRSPSRVSNVPSPLPLPPLTVTRSYSIPSSNQRAMALHVARSLEAPRISERAEEVASPPLTPISLSNVK